MTASLCEQANLSIFEHVISVSLICQPFLNLEITSNTAVDVVTARFYFWVKIVVAGEKIKSKI